MDNAEGIIKENDVDKVESRRLPMACFTSLENSGTRCTVNIGIVEHASALLLSSPLLSNVDNPDDTILSFSDTIGNDGKEDSGSPLGGKFMSALYRA